MCYMRRTLKSCIFHAMGNVVHANCHGTTRVIVERTVSTLRGVLVEA